MTKTFSLMALVVWILLGGTAVAAQPYSPDDLLTIVGQSTIEAGDTVTVSGAGFQPDGEIMIFLVEGEEETELVAEDEEPFVADENGEIELEIEIPEEFSGNGELVARGQAPDGADLELVARVEEGVVIDLLAIEASSNSGWLVGGGVASAAAVVAAFFGRRLVRSA